MANILPSDSFLVEKNTSGCQLRRLRFLWLGYSRKIRKMGHFRSISLMPQILKNDTLKNIKICELCQLAHFRFSRKLAGG